MGKGSVKDANEERVYKLGVRARRQVPKFNQLYIIYSVQALKADSAQKMKIQALKANPVRTQGLQ